MPSTPAFCPTCSQPLARGFVPAEGRDRLVCADGHILYQNPNVVAGTLPIFDGRVWLLRRSIQPRLGYWTFPAGYMEMGESVEEAALRETKEEIGIEVNLLGLHGVYSRAEATHVFVVYLAEADENARAEEEALEVRLFTPEALPWTGLAFWSTKRTLEDWMKRP